VGTTASSVRLSCSANLCVLVAEQETTLPTQTFPLEKLHILEDWNLYTELEKELGEAKLHLSKHFPELAVMLFLLCKEILLLCLLSHIHLVVRHIPGTFNVLADCLSRFHNPVNTEWELRQVVFDSVVLRWDRPQVDLFATSLNHKLETFVSPVPDPLSLGWCNKYDLAI
jgi:hypothetical protein